MLITLIVLIVVCVAIGCFILLTTKICEGGELISGCGKMLFIWSKKVKLPSGRYCCIDCYARDLKLYSQVKIDSEKDVFKFYAKDEMLPQETDEE